jgi:N,N'-diacetyllegionaminate synthase
VIEKHFTLDRGLPGPDHRASLLPNEVLQLVTQIREVELALGSDEKIPSQTELAVRNLVRRSLTARHDMDFGHILKVSDIAILRPGTGIPPGSINEVVGQKLSRSVKEGDILQWCDLQ